MINLELYRIFYVVAETKNITKASIKLNISQPAVTKHIKNLEESLGGTLFIRTKKGVILNEAGQKMFILVKQALTLIDEAEKKFKNLENLKIGTIKIGVSTNMTRKYLLKNIELFHKLYPNIIVEISTDPTEELISLLKKGMIDFIVAKIPQFKDNELDYVVLGQMNDVFVVNSKYKNLINKKISFKELNNYPILLQKKPSNSRLTFDMYCQKNNCQIASIMNIASSNLLIDFVKIGYGIGFITKEYIEKEINDKELFILDVTPLIKPNHYGIIKLKDNHLSFSARKFLDLLN